MNSGSSSITTRISFAELRFVIIKDKKDLDRNQATVVNSKPIDNPTPQSPFNLPRFVPISFHTNIQSVLKICESRETKAR